MTTTGGNVGGIDTGTDAYITEDAYTVEDYGDTAVATVTKEDDKGMMSADAYMVGEPDTATNIEDTDVEGGGGGSTTNSDASLGGGGRAKIMLDNLDSAIERGGLGGRGEAQCLDV